MEFLLNESPLPYTPVYLDGDGVFAVIDREDWEWAREHTWQFKLSKARGFRPRKIYATRKTVDRSTGRSHTVYLHKEVCKRAHGLPPSPKHIVGDHINGNSLDCRRSNMRWATPSENRMNYNGEFARQLRLAFMSGDWTHYLMRGMLYVPDPERTTFGADIERGSCQGKHDRQ